MSLNGELQLSVGQVIRDQFFLYRRSTSPFTGTSQADVLAQRRIDRLAHPGRSERHTRRCCLGCLRFYLGYITIFRLHAMISTYSPIHSRFTLNLGPVLSSGVRHPRG